MKEEKFKKLVIAGTVTAVTLLFILIVFWIYQMISISVRNREIKKLQNEIAYYQELIEEGNLDIVEKYIFEQWLRDRALELNMRFPDAKIIME